MHILHQAHNSEESIVIPADRAMEIWLIIYRDVVFTQFFIRCLCPTAPKGLPRLFVSRTSQTGVQARRPVRQTVSDLRRIGAPVVRGDLEVTSSNRSFVALVTGQSRPPARRDLQTQRSRGL